MPVTVKHIELPSHKRAFAVSDVHGNLDYLKGLLDKLLEVGWGGLTASEAGRIGGLVAARTFPEGQRQR